MSRLAPFLLFTGQAEEAMNFYVSAFSDARIVEIEHWGPEAGAAEGTVKLGRFELAGQRVMCTDSTVATDFTFTPSVSLFVDCETEEEIEALAAALSADGSFLMPLDDHGFSRRYAWLQDRFGVSWQINLPHVKRS